MRLRLGRVSFVEVLEELLTVGKLLHGSPLVRPDRIVCLAYKILDLLRAVSTFLFGV